MGPGGVELSRSAEGHRAHKGPRLDPEKKPPFRSTRLYRKPTLVGAQRMLRRMEE